MKVDELVLKRFTELMQKAEEIEKTKKRGYDTSRVVVSSPLFQEFATSVLSLLQRTFGEDSVHFQHFNQKYKEFNGYAERFNDCCGILKAAIEDYEGGYLLNIKTLVNAEVLDDVIEQAEEFLNAGYKDAACIITGVALEGALRKLCTQRDIEHTKLDSMNSGLCKDNVYNKGKQKQITAWADMRNNAAHGKWNEYSSEDVEDMMKGTGRFIADFL